MPVTINEPMALNDANVSGASLQVGESSMSSQKAAVMALGLSLLLGGACAAAGPPVESAVRVFEAMESDGRRVHVYRDERLPGKPVVQLVLADLDIRDRHLALLGEFPEVRALSLDHSGVTDAGMSRLMLLPKLEWLSMSATRITDRGLDRITRDLRGLKHLVLTETRVTDAGLRNLAALRSLESLDLRDTRNITDAGLRALKAVPSLRVLRLKACLKVTEAGIRELQKALPRLKINTLE
jgi:hypothetical protein